MVAKGRWYVPDPNKAGDFEKLREKALLKKLWQQRTDDAYKTIIAVAEKIPNKILEEDPKLLMWYDQAVTRMGDW